MACGQWYRISGAEPDLGLSTTPPGTRYLADNDPAKDRRLNPARTAHEHLRRLFGRAPLAPWHGRVGFSAITEAWNGAVLASGAGVCGAMVVFGGGHADYYGSDVHAFDIETREWLRISDGWLHGDSPDYGDGAVYPDACYPDGSPLPPHTYDYAQYDPVGNDYLLLKGQLELGERVKAVAIPHLFNLTNRRWRHGPRHPSAILNSGGFTTWDARRRVLWGHSGDDGGGNTFIGFAPDGQHADGSVGRWTEHHHGKLPGIANHNAMQWLPDLDLIVVACHVRDRLGVIDPARPELPILWLECVGERPRLREFAALELAPASGSLIYCSPRDAGAVFAIEPPARDVEAVAGGSWRWRRLDSMASFDPFRHAARVSQYPVNLSHCFGRFRVAHFDGADLAILVRHTDSPVYAMRLDDPPTRP